MIEDFEEAKKQVKELYSDMQEIVRMNPQQYIMPVKMYNAICRKLGHTEDRIRKQTASLKNHLNEKRELRKQLKELEKQLSEVEKNEREI